MWLDHKFPRKVSVAEIETVIKEKHSYFKLGIQQLINVDRSFLDVAVVDTAGTAGEDSLGFVLSWQKLDQYALDSKLFNREGNR